jgi:hypothetical protein
MVDMAKRWIEQAGECRMVRGEVSGWINAARMIELSSISCLIPTFANKCHFVQ